MSRTFYDSTETVRNDPPSLNDRSLLTVFSTSFFNPHSVVEGWASQRPGDNVKRLKNLRQRLLPALGLVRGMLSHLFLAEGYALLNEL